MKLLGRDIPTGALVARIEERLRARGLPTSEPAQVPEDGVEPRVEPLTFNLHALEENADATRALPLHTHRAGAGQVVLLAKWAFRKSCQVLINETLGRQRVFNGLVRDSYAQLSAEVLRLRREVDTLRAQAARAPQLEAARPPDLAYGRPSMPAHDERSASSKPPPSDEGRARPSQPLPDIAYGRPAKAEPGQLTRPSAGNERGRPPKPSGKERGPSPRSPAGGYRRPTKPSDGDARVRPSKPLPDIDYGRPLPSQEQAPRAGQRPVKPPRTPREATPNPEGATPGPTSQAEPPTPTKRPPARRSRAKRGGPKKP